MQRKKRCTSPLTGGERLLLGLVTVFFCATLLRGVPQEPLAHARQTIQTWLTGNFDFSKAVAAIGQFTEQENLQAVFREFFPDTRAGTESKDDSTHAAADPQPADDGASESAIPADGLAADAASLFPDAVDETVYPIVFACTTPTDGTITSRFGTRTHPVTGQANTFHSGLDIAAPEDTPIRAVADGTVIQTGNNSYGNYLVVDHGGGISTLYAHCSRVLARSGQAVQAGETIARVGATGTATGNHLHIEVWRAGKRLDPENYMMLS